MVGINEIHAVPMGGRINEGVEVDDFRSRLKSIRVYAGKASVTNTFRTSADAVVQKLK